VFEFMVAVVIFFAIVIYVLNYLNGAVAGYSGDALSQSMESKVTQIGEMLVMNKGNWTASGGLGVAGLADRWPVLNRTKMSWLNAYCNGNYAAMLDNLGVNPSKRLKIVINETRQNGAVSTLVDCPSGQLVGVKRIEARRYALVPDSAIPGTLNAANVYVYIW
jgi:hypothetical protein